MSYPNEMIPGFIREPSNTASNDDMPTSDLVEETIETAETRITNMQELICFLLYKNQQLRFRLAAAEAKHEFDMIS